MAVFLEFSVLQAGADEIADGDVHGTVFGCGRNDTRGIKYKLPHLSRSGIAGITMIHSTTIKKYSVYNEIPQSRRIGPERTCDIPNRIPLDLSERSTLVRHRAPMS